MPARRSTTLSRRSEASAVRVGTRLLATIESGAHPEYVAALVAAGESSTVLTTAFGADWPDAPHRVLASCVEAAAQQRDGTVAVATDSDRRWEIPRWSATPPTKDTTGEIRAMALYAGTGVAEIDDVVPVAEVIGRLVDEARAVLARP